MWTALRTSLEKAVEGRNSRRLHTENTQACDFEWGNQLFVSQRYLRHQGLCKQNLSLRRINAKFLTRDQAGCMLLGMSQHKE
jgi:hypothetical protein